MMGLSIHPGDAAWSYSGFNDFRRRLAVEEGFSLDEMEGFGGLRGKPHGTRAWADVATVLEPLLHHSDCDGYLDRQQCEDMLPRLREIAAEWAITLREHYDPELDYDLRQFRELIAAMDHSVIFGCSVVFA